MSPSSPDVMDDMDAGQVTVDVGDMAVVDVVDRQERLAHHWDTGSGVVSGCLELCEGIALCGLSLRT